MLNHKNLQYALEVRKQLTDICDRLEIVSNKESSVHNADQVSLSTIKDSHWIHVVILLLFFTAIIFLDINFSSPSSNKRSASAS